MSVPNTIIQGYDPTKYQELKVQADGTLKASEPFFGKIYQFLGMKTHIDKKIIEEFKALVDKKNNDLDKGKLDSKLTYRQLNLITKNISQTINCIKEEHLKVDEGIDLDDFSSRLAQRREVGLLYRKINEGMKEAYELATTKDTIRSGHPYLHFKADYPSIGEYKEKLENLAYKIRVLHLYNIYDGDIPPNLAGSKNRSLSKEQMLAEIDQGIEGLISPLQIGILEENYNRRTIGFGDEFRVRLEIFRDTGIFPQGELTQEQFPREEIVKGRGEYKLISKKETRSDHANLLSLLNEVPLKDENMRPEVDTQVVQLSNLLAEREAKRKVLNRGEKYDSTPSGKKLNEKIISLIDKISSYIHTEYSWVVLSELEKYVKTLEPISKEQRELLRSLSSQRQLAGVDSEQNTYYNNLMKLRDFLTSLGATFQANPFDQVNEDFLTDVLNLKTMDRLELNELNEGVNRKDTEERIRRYINEMVQQLDPSGVAKVREKLTQFVKTGEVDTKELKTSLERKRQSSSQAKLISFSKELPLKEKQNFYDFSEKIQLFFKLIDEKQMNELNKLEMHEGLNLEIETLLNEIPNYVDDQYSDLFKNMLVEYYQLGTFTVSDLIIKAIQQGLPLKDLRESLDEKLNNLKTYIKFSKLELSELAEMTFNSQLIYRLKTDETEEIDKKNLSYDLNQFIDNAVNLYDSKGERGLRQILERFRYSDIYSHIDYNGNILKELLKEIEEEYNDPFFKGMDETEIYVFTHNIALLQIMNLNNLTSIDNNPKDKILGELNAFIEKVNKKYARSAVGESNIDLKARLEAFRDTGTFA
jgi:hypothetical protein